MNMYSIDKKEWYYKEKVNDEKHPWKYGYLNIRPDNKYDLGNLDLYVRHPNGDLEFDSSARNPEDYDGAFVQKYLVFLQEDIGEEQENLKREKEGEEKQEARISETITFLDYQFGKTPDPYFFLDHLQEEVLSPDFKMGGHVPIHLQYKKILQVWISEKHQSFQSKSNRKTKKKSEPLFVISDASYIKPIYEIALDCLLKPLSNKEFARFFSMNGKPHKKHELQDGNELWCVGAFFSIFHNKSYNGKPVLKRNFHAASAHHLLSDKGKAFSAETLKVSLSQAGKDAFEYSEAVYAKFLSKMDS